ncbi:MAG: metalloregulator ArsR/SmtB family transcription factor [Saprospiraceae bacterium]
MKRTKVTFSEAKLNYSCNLMRALAHPLRLRILEYIDVEGETNVNRIYRSLNIEQSITSQHLRVLRLADVVHCERNGKMVVYKIKYDVVSKAERALNNFLAKEKVVVTK